MEESGVVYADQNIVDPKEKPQQNVKRVSHNSLQNNKNQLKAQNRAQNKGQTILTAH